MNGEALMGILAGAAAAMTPQVQHKGGASVVPATVSKAPLPRFPYLRWPADMMPKGAPVEQALGHFRFWDGTALQDVEGRTYLTMLVRRGGGEVDGGLIRRRFETDLTRMGAVRVATGPVPASALATINDADRTALRPGLSHADTDPGQTWIVRRRDRQIWVQFAVGADQASIAVVATWPD